MIYKPYRSSPKSYKQTKHRNNTPKILRKRKGFKKYGNSKRKNMCVQVQLSLTPLLKSIIIFQMRNGCKKSKNILIELGQISIL